MRFLIRFSLTLLGSLEQSPCYVDAYADAFDHDSIGIVGCGESQLKEDLAEAMMETSSTPHKIAGTFIFEKFSINVFFSWLDRVTYITVIRSIFVAVKLNSSSMTSIH